MGMTARLALALRLLARDWRAGELRLLAVAVVIAVGAVSAITFVSDRLHRAMGYQSADLLGADLVLTAPRPPDPLWVHEAAVLGLVQVQVLEFASVVVHGERQQLASVAAVGEGYPLRGALRAAATLYGPEAPVAGVPVPGTAWVEARLLHALGIGVGETIEVGTAAFTVTRVLTFEPGRGGNFFALAPRVLITLSEVPRTGVVQPGSRVTYKLLLAGPASAVERYRHWLAPRLDPSHRLIDVREGNPSIGRALERAERYLGLAALLAVLLAGIAIVMGARRYSERHFDASAMLRALGASQRDILFFYLTQLLALGLAASVVGCAAGWLVQHAIFIVLADFVPAHLPLPGPAPVAVGLLTGLAALAGFALPQIERLRAVPPLRVLRRELAPLPARGWAVLAGAAAAVVILMWRYTGSAGLIASVLAGAAIAAALFGLAAYALLDLLRRLPRRVAGRAWRLGIDNLWRRRRASVGQMLAFGLALMAMGVMAVVRTDLLATWQSQLPRDAPNHFAFNILPEDVAPIQRFFEAHGIAATALYPMVRGRLVAINGVPVTQAVTKEERANETIHRELNLTWARQLPPDNAVVHGQWWSGAELAPRVSVEEKLARRLGIGPGDALRFLIGGEELEAEVASIRSVQWDSFRPNFFMIFPPGALDGHPATYLTGFRLEPGQKPLLTRLVRAFPAVTVMEMDRVLEQVRTILQQVTFAVELLLVFVLAAGFAVLAAALQSSLDERFYEGALLRALGASRRQLRAGHLAEFVTLGLAAGLLAALGTELVAYLLYARLLALDYAPKWPVWMLAPLAGAVLVGSAGYLGTRRVMRQSPIAVLREL